MILRNAKFIISVLALFALFALSNFAFSSETSGIIDSTYKYAWGENIGWINFGCEKCGVTVTDDDISGYAWSKQLGWINLNPTNGGISNDAEGTLSGYAWGSNIGWIDFTGVTISSTGEFLGYATVENDSSKISFNCSNGSSCASADFKVKTDWEKRSNRPTAGGGSSGSYLIKKIDDFLNIPIVNKLGKKTNEFYSKMTHILKSKKNIAQEVIPKTAPFSMRNKWNLLPVEAINRFVFAPLPYQVKSLATKFPDLEETFKQVGVERFNDVQKLNGVTFNINGLSELEKIIRQEGVAKLDEINELSGVALEIPGFSSIDQKLANNVGVGEIGLLAGLPVAEFPSAVKKNIPAEFVFTRTGGEMIDYDVALSVGNKGEVTQQISSLPGKVLKLVVKPISKARNVTGYIVFKSATPSVSKKSISRSSLMASAIFSMNGIVEDAVDINKIESKLVLSSFEYTDPDHDGIYTADVISPSVPGEYEVITVIDYFDPELGTRQMRMIEVIDPEGYIYEKNKGKETRIPGAIITLFYLNKTNSQYELWPAEKYQQKNPQVTDIRGTYSFLVPEGSYYFEVTAPGYKPYHGKTFIVSSSNGVHENIELKEDGSFVDSLDYKTILLIVVLLLLVYNLYRNTLREKLLKFRR